MKVIAHRPFRDERSLAQFDPRCLAGFDGVELDLRCTPEGVVAVFHAPIFTASRRPAPGAAKSLETVLQALAEVGAPTRLMFLDVKTTRAAERMGEILELLGPERDVAFICWHLDEVALVRRAAPAAKVFLAVIPLRRARTDGTEAKDYFLFNRFPYVARAQRFRQRAGQFNQHNINLRWLDPEDIPAGLPEGFDGRIDGVCFHKRLFDPVLCEAFRANGVEIAVYGMPSRRDRAIARMAEHIDFAIVDPDLDMRAGRRRTAPALRRAQILRRRLRRLGRADGA